MSKDQIEEIQSSSVFLYKTGQHLEVVGIKEQSLIFAWNGPVSGKDIDHPYGRSPTDLSPLMVDIFGTRISIYSTTAESGSQQ